MRLTWSYKVSLCFIVLFFVSFVVSPSIAAHALSVAVVRQESENWRQQVDKDYFHRYSRALMDGFLRAKLALDSNNDEGIRAAMQDYQFAKTTVLPKAGQFAEPKGFAHLLCGEVTSYPELPEQHDQGCWVLDGDVQWHSLSRISVNYLNPERNWTSRLQFQRIGLFTWQVVDIDLPVESMLERFRLQIQ